MDLLRLATVVKRHRLIMLFGILLGCVAVAGTMFKLSGGHLVPRSYTTYSADMQMIVIDPHFGLGSTPHNQNDPAPDSFDKTVALAQTYGNLLTGDAVRHAADASVGTLQGDVVSQAVQQSPIIDVTLTGKDAPALTRYGLALSDAFQRYLTQEQQSHNIAPDARMAVRLLATPNPKPQQSRAWEMAVIAFLGPLVAAYGLALLRDRRFG
jgi:hypothetical protein